jgi:hypothetical protein
MRREVILYQPPVSDRLHPIVYMVMVGLVLWLVLSVWGFADDGYAEYLLAVVSGFVFVVVAIPCILWWVWRNNKAADAAQVAQNDASFRDWAAGEFATWQDRVKGTNAAIEALLPIAAAAFGMTAFAIVLQFTARGG